MKRAIGFAAFVCVLIAACSAVNPGPGPGPVAQQGNGGVVPPKPGLAAGACVPPGTPNSNWFPHANTPAPDSTDFGPDSTNCDFHIWSWNAFLWLTQDVGGQPRFLSMSTDGIGGIADGVLDPLIGRSQQARTVELIDQAGPDGVLVDRNGRAVYYSIHSNDVFGQFIASNGLQDPKKLRAFNPDAAFPVGSMTLKAAWKVVQPGEDVSTFYTRQAQVAKLGTRKGKIVATADTETVTVALVGFHIGGTVEGHPEMIWATFEHQDNAPDLPQPMEKMQPNDIVSAKDWTFYQANTPMKQCNLNAAGSGALTLNAQTQTLSPVTQVCRMVPYGGQKPCPSGQDCNIDNIKSMNAAVDGQLNDVWKNYFEVGAIWFNKLDALQPNCTFQPGSALECVPTGGTSPLLTGSVRLSNSTIETFTQVQSTQDNCFACHNTTQVISPDPRAQSLPGLNVNLSHVVINDYFQAQLPQKAPPAPRPASPR